MGLKMRVILTRVDQLVVFVLLCLTAVIILASIILGFTHNPGCFNGLWLAAIFIWSPTLYMSMFCKADPEGPT